MFRWIVILLLLMFIGLQYRLWFGDENVRQVLALKRSISEQQLTNEKLQQRNRQLEAEVHDLKHGLSALEERARSEMGMIRKDETFYQLVDPPGNDDK